jgi:hypothetical protein
MYGIALHFMPLKTFVFEQRISWTLGSKDSNIVSIRLSDKVLILRMKFQICARIAFHVGLIREYCTLMYYVVLVKVTHVYIYRK